MTTFGISLDDYLRKLIADRDVLLKALREIWEEADNRADIDDEGRPNFAMQIQVLAQAAIEKTEGGAK